MFSIKSLCDKSNISQQTFYRLIRENAEFRALVESNREKKGNSYRYDTVVLEWLCAYYERDEETSSAQIVSEASESPSEPPKSSSVENTTDALKREIEALQAQIEALKTQLAEKESERKQLFENIQHLLLLLSQEKAEKQLLLPPPRKPFFQRLFGRKKREEEEPNA